MPYFSYPPHRKNGYATEAAHALAAYGFTTCRLSNIFACTPKLNISSIEEMERLGMCFVTTLFYPAQSF
ncbi:MAG: hypothetical protein COT85_06400 [Chlamydiae bacterium CG10_big_fil_rev_8_21_14_0_10_42_34]|nr:MAG: hypothetical protein COT85_06400 [Chlamydiae bacterium CG10_big_fil_rev_8_21_14_0_10_42_34]